MKKTVRIGETKIRNLICPVFCQVEIDQGRLSITGVEGPKRNGDAVGGCGQISKPDFVSYAAGWSEELASKFWQVWDRWHLNDMRAGCEHQRAEGWTHCPGHYEQPTPDMERARADLRRDGVALVHGGGRHYYCTAADAPPQGPKCPGNVQPLCKPCPVCGYKYGSAWLCEALPAEVVEFLQGLPESDQVPAWV